MSHTNKINEIQSDDYNFSVNDYNSASKIASGKDIFGHIKPFHCTKPCVRLFI